MLIKEYDHSINFIDINDVFVGFDLSIQCYEHCEWRLTNDQGVEVAEVVDYTFDTSFVQEFFFNKTL